jgi:hypothetical protein
MPPKLNQKRALFVLTKIDEILAWERRSESDLGQLPMPTFVLLISRLNPLPSLCVPTIEAEYFTQ